MMSYGLAGMTGPRRIAGALICALALILVAFPTPDAQAASARRLVAQHSMKCLDISAFSWSNGARIQQWTCSGGWNQRFYEEVGWTAELGSYVKFRNPTNGKCLDVEGFSTANGARILQWTCHGGYNQRFYWVSVWHNGAMREAFRNVLSGKCLDVGGWSTDDGAPVIQWTCHYGANQLFN